MAIKGKISLLIAALSVILLLTFNSAAFADSSVNARNIYDQIDAYLSEVVPKTHFPSLIPKPYSQNPTETAVRTFRMF